MDDRILFFFREHLPALDLYEAFETRLLTLVPGARVKVSKTQISFSNRYAFAFVSFLPVRRASCRPDPFITVSFGLDVPVDSPRIDARSEPAPNRWTHHLCIGRAGEIDEELMGWIARAAAFAARK